ncbi:D-xylulose reductase [Geosmithia morbida]|uniref:L-arabinitol 4-dehydrogenase n=1 Tax=Geosmithia morbida TaxID=1094350 RepID=A0A9P5D8F3_9HYPO|nr:D-xylulose reductase [Geosmithia morbida]KAF4125464.1 D-xylulose reductase [Geosmithia morbida]
MTEANPAFVLRELKKVTFEDRQVPKLDDPHDVRVHIEQTGICGSDVHYWQRGRIGDFVLTSPIVLGHESAGVVVETGSKVENVRVGDRVAIEPGVPCRRCDFCRSGSYNLCEDTVFAATPPHDGTLQKYYTVASDYVYPIPDHMSSEDGALVEPVSVAVQIVKVSDLRAGQTVLVFGCGPIGVLCQAVAKASGAAKVIGVDISEARAQFARDFTADGVFLNNAEPTAGADPVDAAREVAEKIVADYGLGLGADVVLECTGAEPCIQAGVFAAKKGGTYVQAGMGKENVVFPITAACIRALTIKGSIRYSAGCYPEAVRLISAGKIQPSKLITHRFAFTQAEEAFEIVKQAAENTLKVIIKGVPR